MSRRPMGVPDVESAPATRSLPANANLEFERKRAKALLRRLRRESPDAKLSDAQFAVARELGFVSWPRLVQYFDTLERDALSERNTVYKLDFYDGGVRSLLAEHGARREWAARSLAAFVPRFYGRSIADVLASAVTVDDARVAVARRHRFSSWEHLQREVEHEELARDRKGDLWQQAGEPFGRALRAIETHDLTALNEVVREHPALLRMGETRGPAWRTLIWNAAIVDRNERTPEARRVTDWLVDRGADLAPVLNRMLLGHFGITPATVQHLIDWGADPNWMPPNGVSVLEHALLKYGNGAAVDVLAKHVTPPSVFWIAAGLGDGDKVRGYFDRRGKLTAAAFEHRAPLSLIGPSGFPSLPDPDQHELLAEVALVAAMNGRTAVIELLIDRGFPIDYDGWGGTSMLRFAIGQKDTATIRALLRRGADLDRKGEGPHASAREFARTMALREPGSPVIREILELCGAGTVEEVFAEADRERGSPPPLGEEIQEALDLASDDAARHGSAEIRAENLFVGVLRSPRPLPLAFLSGAGVALERLRGALAERLQPGAERAARPKLSLSEAAQVVIARSVAIADERRHERVNTLHLLAALVECESGFASDLIVAYGGKLGKLRDELSRA